MLPIFFERLQAPLSHEPENVSEQIRIALTAFMSSELRKHQCQKNTRSSSLFSNLFNSFEIIRTS